MCQNCFFHRMRMTASRFLRSINPIGLRLLFTGGTVSDIREAVDWERK